MSQENNSKLEGTANEKRKPRQSKTRDSKIIKNDSPKSAPPSDSVSRYAALHRVSEILISLLDKDLAKSKKYPEEANVVNILLKDFMQKKIEEIYGPGTLTQASNEPGLSKAEAQQMILGFVNAVKNKIPHETQIPREDQRLLKQISIDHVLDKDLIPASADLQQNKKESMKREKQDHLPPEQREVRLRKAAQNPQATGSFYSNNTMTANNPSGIDASAFANALLSGGKS